MKLSQEKLEAAALVLQRVANGSMLDMLENLATVATQIGDPDTSLVTQFLGNSKALEGSINDVTVQTTKGVLQELSVRFNLVEFLEKNADIGKVASIETDAGIDETNFDNVLTV